MSTLSPRDASILALIAENRKSPKQVQKLLRELNSSTALGIAKSIVASAPKGSKTERQVAEAIREWADTNDPKQLAASSS
jgi:hypothetical protein